MRRLSEFRLKYRRRRRARRRRWRRWDFISATVRRVKAQLICAR